MESTLLQTSIFGKWKITSQATTIYLIIGLLFLCNQKLNAQIDSTQKAFEFSGQLSAWGLYNPDIELNMWYGARYLPQLNYKKTLKEQKLFDAELSANIFGNLGTLPFDTINLDGDIKPYRAWLRYSTEQMELRAGLQKINFGSATILRPLRWFDQIDPRDPLQLTDGVYGLLWRYYFLDNANLWFWGLYGNKKHKGWEVLNTAHWIPELGGRYQRPVKMGELALTYHLRMVDSSEFGQVLNFDHAVENRIGLDGKWDLAIGLWFEGTYTHKTKELDFLKHQMHLNAGMDYTFGIGNGLNIIFEQLFVGIGPKAFDFGNNANLSALALSYPIGLFDNLSGFLYYDWDNKEIYNTLRYQRDFKNVSLNILGFWNPLNNLLPQQGSTENLFGGRGIQVLIVYNH